MYITIIVKLDLKNYIRKFDNNCKIRLEKLNI